MKLVLKFTSSLFLLSVLSVQGIAQGKKVGLLSPDGHIKVSINLSDKIYYSVSDNNKDLLTETI